MLAKIAPRFVIAGVIENSYYAHYMSVDLLKQVLGEGAIAYHFDNPKKYYVKILRQRNATFTGTSRPCQNPPSFQISSKLKSMRKPARNLKFITK